jgi:RHS repeat-associated protein
MLQPGRKFEAVNHYRYGFNGKENDNEVKGEGNQQDYGMRIYDPRLGRFLSVDPLTKSYPWFTPYQFASNSPIIYIDIDGAEGGLGGLFLPNVFSEENTDKVKAKLGVKKGSFWDKAIDFVAGSAERVHQLNDPRTYANAAIQNSQPAKIIKTFTAPTKEERIKSGVSIFLPSLETAEQFTEQSIKIFNGDMRAAGGLTVDVTFNLALAEASSSKKLWVPYKGKLTIGPKTLARVTKHLEKIGYNNLAENQVMLRDLEKIAKGEMKSTEIHINFAKHELRESDLMKAGYSQEEAHYMTLKEQGMYHPDYAKKLYTQEALDAGHAADLKEIKNK